MWGRGTDEEVHVQCGGGAQMKRYMCSVGGGAQMKRYMCSVGEGHR